MYLYHATFGERVEDIRKTGLKRFCEGNWGDIYTNEHLFFAFSPSVAVDYAETSDAYDDSKVTVFRVNSKDLDMEKIRYDWNNRCEYRDNINSVAYEADVTPECLYEMSEAEILSSDELIFSDLEHTDDDGKYIFDVLLDVFTEEVETNIENI